MLWPWQPREEAPEAAAAGSDGLFTKPSFSQSTLSPTLSPCASDTEPSPLPSPLSNAAASSSVHDWLENVKPGYGRFVAAFDALGIEDSLDVAQVDQRCYEEIERVLTDECGAKPMHLRNIRLALQGLGCEGLHGSSSSSKAAAAKKPRPSVTRTSSFTSATTETALLAANGARRAAAAAVEAITQHRRPSLPPTASSSLTKAPSIAKGLALKQQQEEEGQGGHETASGTTHALTKERPPLNKSDSTIARAQQFEEYQKAMSQMSSQISSSLSGTSGAGGSISSHGPNSAGGLWARLARGVETEAELHQFFARRQARAPNGAGRTLHIGSAVKVVNNSCLQAFVSGKGLVKDALRAHRVADSFLFHGCPQAVAANIQSDGLKMSFAANGMLGRGLYGAPDPRKSLQYCKDSALGKFMFVCRYNLSQAKRAGPDTQHRNTIFDEFCVTDERHVVVLWMIKLA